MIDMKSYLKAVNFSGHPFNTFDADKEKNLKKFVTLPPYFESILGVVDDPQPFLVLGMRGLGKTTLKCMLKDKLEKDYERIMIVDYNSYPFTRVKELNEVTLKDHLLEVNKLIAKQIYQKIMVDNSLCKKFKAKDKEALFHILEIYLDEEEKEEIYPVLMSFFEKIFKKYPKQKGRAFYLLPETDELQVVSKGIFTFDQCKRIVNILGYTGCYIFIDRLDETNRTDKEPEKAGNLLGPLISNLEIVQNGFFSFKFFVPAESIPNLKKMGFRNDKIQNQLITWTNDKLAEVLRKRVMAFNPEGKMLGKLGSICAEEIKDHVDQFVVQKSLSSPRNMLRFCNAIFAEHIESAQDFDEKISKKTIATALKKYEYSLKVDQYIADE
ncbi:MAG: hypothetical protein KC646_17125 [Candidatus Cloacimonetes bacterium]|nr:hypothetical protein [Candidatus Cloacimonadota bacterium]